MMITNKSRSRKGGNLALSQHHSCESGNLSTSQCHSRESGNPEGFKGGVDSGFPDQLLDMPGRVGVMDWITIVVILSILVSLLPNSALAQEKLNIEWEVEEALQSGWTIGDPIGLKLIVTGSADVEAALPELPSEWGSFEVIEQSIREPVDNGDGTVTLIGEATIIPWETGELIPPAVNIQYRDSSNNISEAIVPVLSIPVGSVLTGSDTQKRDLKPQATLSLPGGAIWPWVLLGVVVLILVVAAVWWIIRRRRRRGNAELNASVFIDDRYPEEIAYEKLDRVVELNLPPKGEFKRHYDLVTDCIRAYIEGIYQVPAMEHTTSEIMRSVKKLNRSKSNEIAPSLQSLLEEADLVKFAKFTPTVETAVAAVKSARRIVDITRPERELDDMPQSAFEDNR